MHLTLLCSASTDSSRRATFPGDEPLDAQGSAAAAALAEKLGRPGLVLVSPAVRARETAEALGLAGAIDERLREIDYGRWAGQALKDVAAREPDAAAAWLSDPEVAPHGGESVAALFARVGSWLAEISGDSRRVLAIAHPGPMRAAAAIALSAPFAAFWQIDVEPLARLTLTSDSRRWHLRALVEPESGRLR